MDTRCSLFVDFIHHKSKYNFICNQNIYHLLAAHSTTGTKAKIKMVTNFVELAKMKTKSGPWGRAQQSLDRTVSTKGSRYTKRRAVHRRKRRKRDSNEKERQGRVVHKLHRVLKETVTGMYLYYNWGEKNPTQQSEVCKKYNVEISHSVDVSNYRIIDSTKTRHAVCIEDKGGDDVTFICGKIDTTQAHSVMGGRHGYNELRKSIEQLKNSKDDQDRGKETSGVNTSYKLVGHRKDPLSNVNSEYSFIPGSRQSHIQMLRNIYCGLAHKMEKCARRLGNALFETGMYSFIQEQAKIPAVAIDPTKSTKSNHSK